MLRAKVHGWWLAAALLAGVGCGDDSGEDTARLEPCATDPDLFDADGDTIHDGDDGLVGVDSDGDGIANYLDDDSDGDGILDLVESGADRIDCSIRPIDTDTDGVPDFLDLDSNGDGVDDAASDLTADRDSDGRPDYLETDVDGDGIPNSVEVGLDGLPVDTDGDGIFDFADTDSDGDLVCDRAERDIDPDGDETLSFRDLDSDGDGIGDTAEAGNPSAETCTPTICEFELNLDWNQEDDLDGRPSAEDFVADGFADFLDQDSDNDGLTDGEELALGTEKCGWDTDGDGLSDLVEAAYERINCPDGPDAEGARGCGCATDMLCTIPETDFFVILPYRGEPVIRPLEFGTTIRSADVFFLTDTTGSMGGTLGNVQDAVVDLVDQINLSIPDAWYGGGAHDDFPFSFYGTASCGDVVLRVASRVLPPSQKEDVQDAFAAIDLNCGASGPESQTEALYQLMTGFGQTWTFSGSTYSVPAWVSECVEEGFGAACFRPLALQIVVHFTDVCSHMEPPGGSSSCAPYTGISPAPHTWNEAILQMNKYGAKYIGINAGFTDCDLGAPAAPSSTPCFYLAETAESTQSVDVNRDPLVYNLPNDAANATFVEVVAGAVDRIATRVPFDVDTTVRDDPSDVEGVDARDFIRERRPACSYNRLVDDLPDPLCWTPPEGLTPEESVAFIDTSTFFDIIPGTRVTFDITFANDTVRGGDRAKVFVAFIDVRGDGSAVLDTRQVIIVVPGGCTGTGTEFDCGP